MARTKSRKTHRYSEELKSKAVQLSQLEGVSVQEVARTLDIHPFMLSKWRKEFREGKIRPGRRVALVSLKEEKDLNRIESLKNEVAQLKQENALLKKWQRFLGEERRNALSSSRETEKNFL